MVLGYKCQFKTKGSWNTRQNLFIRQSLETTNGGKVYPELRDEWRRGSMPSSKAPSQHKVLYVLWTCLIASLHLSVVCSSSNSPSGALRNRLGWFLDKSSLSNALMVLLWSSQAPEFLSSWTGMWSSQGLLLWCLKLLEWPYFCCTVSMRAASNCNLLRAINNAFLVI
jgi:hypothetical protein